MRLWAKGDVTVGVPSVVVEEARKVTGKSDSLDAIRAVLKLGLAVFTIIQKDGCKVMIHEGDKVRELTL